MGGFIEHDTLVVVAEIGGRTNQARVSGIHGQQVTVNSHCLGHGLGKKSHPGIVSQEYLTAATFQEGRAFFRPTDNFLRTRVQFCRLGDNVHNVIEGVYEIDIHEGESGSFVTQGKLRLLQIAAVREP